MLKIKKSKVSFPQGPVIQLSFILEKVVIGNIYLKPWQLETFMTDLKTENFMIITVPAKEHDENPSG